VLHLITKGSEAKILRLLKQNVAGLDNLQVIVEIQDYRNDAVLNHCFTNVFAHVTLLITKILKILHSDVF